MAIRCLYADLGTMAMDGRHCTVLGAVLYVMGAQEWMMDLVCRVYEPPGLGSA